MQEMGSKLELLKPEIEALISKFDAELERRPAGRKLRQVDRVEVLEALMAALNRFLGLEGGEPASAPSDVPPPATGGDRRQPKPENYKKVAFFSFVTGMLIGIYSK